MSHDVLHLFHPAVSRWFAESFSSPTPAQEQGWPRIAAGENTLILAPTGSGKTLAAFLYAISELLSHPARPTKGVHTLYISPLKALANDVEKNLQAPLLGAAACAQSLDLNLRDVSVGLRTGDTPPAERRRMLRVPPELLITTPESLHLLLTSPRAREMLRTVAYVIVDEIHSLAPTKRGTFLALLLERLEEITADSPVRIGLSATQRPLELVACYLGGCDDAGDPRPVSIVDAGMRKDIDIEVVVPVEDMTDLPKPDGIGPTIWSSIFRRLLDEIEEHESTLVFANNRRLVERVAAELNRLAGHDLVRAHHGSVSREQRLEIEGLLKAGRLPALAATSSLELGIDVGAIDLVCQIESPISVASALQRVGRAGHLVRQTSKGRLLPKTRDDLLRMAAIARCMQRGEISSVHVPEKALDVLAQQIVAMASLEPWSTENLFRCVRRAYPYRDLPHEAFTSVLELVSGRYRAPDVSALRPRVAWDRRRDLIEGLPGSRQAVVLNGGTIPDTGQYAMVLDDGKTKLGELDEEFVFERRLGQIILLGTTRWRILDIGADRVIVAPSDDSEAVMPFWKGEGLGHDAEHGRLLGAFLRECEQRLDSPQLEGWLRKECALDQSAARNLAAYVREQAARGGGIPNDRRILLDAFRNEAGDKRLAILSPFGRAFHLGLLLAIQGTLREFGQKAPQAVFSNVGILLRVGTLSVDEILNVLRSLSADNIEERIVAELEHTPFFAFRFRRNAGRALLLPRFRPGKRTPLWLQRLRAHDLLSHAKEHPAFPIITETYREILEDLLPMLALKSFLGDVEAQEATYAVRRDAVPSPFAASLLLDFVNEHLYADDAPAPASRSVRFDRQGMVNLLRERAGRIEISAEALKTIEERLQGIAPFDRARDGVELVDLLRRIGDTDRGQLAARCEPTALEALDGLIADGRVAGVTVQGSDRIDRLVCAEDEARYVRWDVGDREWVVRRFIDTHGGVTKESVEERYPGCAHILDGLLEANEISSFITGSGETAYADPDILAGARRLTLSKKRKQYRPVAAEAFSAAVLRRQSVSAPGSDECSLQQVLEQLSGWVMPLPVWLDALAARVEGFRFEQLEELIRRGEMTWRADPERRAVAFASLDDTWTLPRPDEEKVDGLAKRILSRLDERGPAFAQQIAHDVDAKPSDVVLALWDLIWKGRVTNDSLSPILAGRPDPSRHDPRRRAPWGGGRWSANRPSDPEGFKPDGDHHIADGLRLLFDRYGILCREMVGREPIDIDWRYGYPVLSRMEWRGEADRGLFVSGLSGLQFASPGAADALHAPVDEGAIVMIPTADPANVWGDVVPLLDDGGERIAIRRNPGTYLILRGGTPIVLVEGRGSRLTPLRDLDRGELTRGLSLLRRLVAGHLRQRSIRVQTWAGHPVTESPIAADLESAGFMREDRSMVLFRSFGEAE